MVSPKRSLSPEGDKPESKRFRVAETSNKPASTDTELESQSTASHAEYTSVLDTIELPPTVWTVPNPHHQSRVTLQQSIARILHHDGFQSTAPEALESFTQVVETYMESLITTSKQLALSSRRDHPTPHDFEKALRRHNVPVSSLKPHIKHPIPQKQLSPLYTNAITLDDDPYTTLPLLDDELSGKPDRDARPYIPSSFPEFPSKHTYKFTPQDNTDVRDSKRVREQVARTAQQGEEALRRLVRASKMRKQKEVKSLVERDTYGKERFRLWESTMKRFMTTEGNNEHADQGEVADHSMIVNSDAAFARKDVSRLGKRPSPSTKSTSIQGT